MAELSKITLPNGNVYDLKDTTARSIGKVSGVKGNSQSSYRTGDVNITATNIGLGNLTNNKQVKGLSSGTTNNNLVAWGSDGYTVADSGIAKGSVATKLALSGTNYSASSNTITVTKANLQSAVQDSDLVLMTAAERTKLASIDTGGNYVTVGGTQTVTGAKTFSAITSFTNSVKIGQSLSVTGTGSLAQGYSATSSGNYSAAFGSSTTSSGRYSHAQGIFSIASEEASHAEGNHTEANGYASHAEGNYTIASNPGSHAEGSQTLASGTYSHAEGYQTRALEDWSHAQGSGSVALKQGAHAEGLMSIASGEYSHAEGSNTKAIGNNSHASGEGTYVTRDNQFAIGKYNRIIESATNPPICSNTLICGDDVIVDGQDYIADSGNYAFIIGNGSNNLNRSNLLAISQQTSETQGFISIWNPNLSIETTPSSANNNMALYLGDKDGNRMGCIAYNHNSEGDIGIILQGYKKYNNNNIYNTLNLSIDSSGNNKVVVSSPTAWRKALELQIPTISIPNIIVPGYISNGSKDVTFSIPLNRIPYGTPKITNLSIALRGGDGQQYLYEASGSNNNTYTQLGTAPVAVWENNATKRVNGVTGVSVSNNVYIGLLVNVQFKNTLRKSASTTVAQNNAPYGIQMNATISFT